MIGVVPGRQVSAQTHGDGARRDLGKSRDDDDARGGVRAGQSGRQRERNGESIGHPYNDVAYEF